ncbi:hypothetical protein GCM10011506_46890 [Marivirga lumbricoides]|uniref:Uncharacterized protein n=1 Tax=Marivirga lumbricoides TaxID=1046115 RepID=A0ABQ1NA55_9BACT|nr:hypothetical protein GCM10011506_46890 [Marivirga lumbricoides]
MDKLKLQSLLVLLFALSTIPSFAQEGFIEGYIITTQQDTLYGEVKDRTREPFGKLYRKIRLKQNGKLFTKKYSPSDVISYRKGEDLFESIWLKEKSEFFKTVYISEKGVGEQRFLKVVLKGDVSYYHVEWRDPDSGYYDYHGYLINRISDKSLYIRFDLFGISKKKVITYLNDCSAIINLLEEGDDPSIQDMVTIYNTECSAQ